MLDAEYDLGHTESSSLSVRLVHLLAYLHLGLEFKAIITKANSEQSLNFKRAASLNGKTIHKDEDLKRTVVKVL